MTPLRVRNLFQLFGDRTVMAYSGNISVTLAY